MNRISALALTAFMAVSAVALRAAATTPTTTTLTIGPNPSSPGLNVSMEAIVTPSAATGTVQFTDGPVVIANQRMISGKAIVLTATLTPGVHYIIATYQGSSTYLPSTSTIVAEVVGTTTTTTVASAPNPAGLSTMVSLTGTVNTSGVTGSLAFYAGTTVLGKANLSGQSATLLTPKIPPGPNQIFARYLGDTVYAGSLSAPAIETINSAPGGTFSTGTTYPFTPAPAFVAAVDVNGDNRPDLIVGSASTLSVALANGDGTFRPATPYTLSGSAVAIATGDFNSDGHVDLAVAIAKDLVVLLGNGDGTFQAPVSLGNKPGNVSGVTVADFNGDGVPDIAFAATNKSISTVFLLISNNDGTFQAALANAAGSSSGVLIAADFNNDGYADLALADPTNNVVWILMASPGGSLKAAVSISAGTNPVSLIASDFTGDGKLDLGALNGSAGTFTVLTGNGDGTFGTAFISTAAAGATSAVSGDWNGDGKMDIAEVGPTGVLVQIGAGGGIFQPPAAFPIGSGLTALAATDLNSDGISDLIAAGTSGATILLGKPLTNASLALTVTPRPATYGQAVTVTVMVSPTTATGPVTFYDGVTPIGSAPLAGGQASITTTLLTPGNHSIVARYPGDLSNLPANSASVTETITTVPGGSFVSSGTSLTGSGPYAVAVGDFNGDGIPDFAYTNYNSTTVSILLGTGNGAFASPTTITTGSNPNSIVAADFNLDGIQDLAVTNNGSNNVALFFGNGDGTFRAGPTYTVTNPSFVGVADFNNDGRPDLIVIGPQALVMLGVGDGTLQPPLTLSAGSLPYSAATGDFNGDGNADIAIANRGDGTVSVLTGNGAGGFTSAGSFAAGSSAASIVTADLDGDGRLDLAVTSLLNSTVMVLHGNGDGTFQGGIPYTVGSGSSSVVAADFNGDGHMDLAVANSLVSSVSILVSNAAGSFLSAVTYTTGSGPSALAVADVNGDGRPDLAVAAYSANSLSFLEDVAAPISAVQGTPQSANLNSVFTKPFKVSVTAFGAPLQGATVTFTAPASGPSGTFTGWGASAIVSAGTDGTATAPMFTANSVSGTYAVSAAIAGNSTSFNLTNTTTGCTYTVSPTSIAFGNGGGSQSVQITVTGSSCSWTATTDSPSWVTLSPASGSASGSVKVTIAANTTGIEKTGNVFLGGRQIPVTSWGTAQIFSDVPPSAYYFDAVNLLFAKGITTGCSPTTYCPADIVTRAQMAIFIVRAVIGSDNFIYSPTPYFADVPSGAFGFAWIQKLYELGITTGCGNNDYCPDESVARDQMAVFIIRARFGSAATFTYPSAAYFTDVPASYWAFSYIQRMRFDQITTGCTATTYCPSSQVTRGDMAIFIMRGEFNQLLPAGTPVLTAISPASVLPGGSVTVTVTGANTGFIQGLTELAAIPSFTAGAVTVTSPTTFAVTLTADSSAPLQPVSLTAITGSQQAVLPNGLVVQ